MRFNTFDCTVYHNSNLVPEFYEIDDYQVQHADRHHRPAHPPAEVGPDHDGRLGQRLELRRRHALAGDGAGAHPRDPRLQRLRRRGCRGREGRHRHVPRGAATHPYFGPVASTMGGRFPEAVERRAHDHPALVLRPGGQHRPASTAASGIIFTHDHYGPSTHQQIGLYATVLTEPAGSRWMHNETGTQLGQNPDGTYGRTLGFITRWDNTAATDGGPTSWQAMIIPPATAPANVSVKSAYRSAAPRVLLRVLATSSTPTRRASTWAPARTACRSKGPVH